MGFTLIEKVKGDLVTMLQAYLPARLNALEAEYADGVALPDIANADYYTHVVDPSTATYQGGTPLLVVVAGRVTNINEEVSDIVAWSHLVRLSYVYRQPEGDVALLDKVLLRSTRAICELLYEHMGDIGSVKVTTIYYDQPVFSTGEGYLQEIVIELEVTTYEQA